MLDKTINKAYFIDVAIPTSNSLYAMITEQLQKYKDLKKALTRMRQLKRIYTVYQNHHYYPERKLSQYTTQQFKLVYTSHTKAVICSTWRIQSAKVLTEQLIRNDWSVTRNP
jgi:hypothetical protein